MKTLLLTSALLTAITYGAGTILSVDFTGQPGNINNQPLTLNPTDIAGVVPDDDWHDAPNNVNSMTYSEAGGTHLFTWSSDYSHILWNASSTPDEIMMDGFISPFPFNTLNLTVAFDLLALCPTATSYDVYVYANAIPSGSNQADYTMNSLGFSSTIQWENLFPLYGTLGFATYVEATGGYRPGNYMVFRGLTNPSFTLDITTNTSDLAPLNGIQIVPQEAPEVSSALLSVLSSMLMICRRKRKSS